MEPIATSLRKTTPELRRDWLKLHIIQSFTLHRHLTLLLHPCGSASVLLNILGHQNMAAMPGPCLSMSIRSMVRSMRTLAVSVRNSFILRHCQLVAVALAGLLIIFFPGDIPPFVPWPEIGCIVTGLLFGWLAGHLYDRLTRKTSQDGDLLSSQGSSSLLDWPELHKASLTLQHFLTGMTGHQDEVFRQAALARVAAIVDEARWLTQGQIAFSGTEGWRTVYERLLSCPDVRRYRSVAWIKNEDYWQNAPGRRSMQINFETSPEGSAH